MYVCNFCFAQSSQKQDRQTPHTIEDIVSVSIGTSTSFKYTPTSEVSFEKIYRKIIALLDEGKYDEAIKYFPSWEKRSKEAKFLSEEEKRKKAESLRGWFLDIVEVLADGIDIDTGEGILYILGKFESDNGDNIPIVYTFKKENGLWYGII
mgnify:CR=1 FL=1